MTEIYSYYKPAHGAYSRLDRFVLANDGTLDVRRAAYQVRLPSDHAPLLLEYEAHAPRPVILLWLMRPELLGDPEYRGDLQAAVNGYFSENWTTIRMRGIEWEAV
ncbi:hypothetical protein NDU88_006984 [Pleurodeles waltl]|uniref:Uncharacterized protein n=1 Tax=Pleurodeles waltl TaxID=8319 RepID=A0AAV7VRG0_PLEWA|nr:hypothetical protein NDU88_006984 [Pleurodeles waltl]